MVKCGRCKKLFDSKEEVIKHLKVVHKVLNPKKQDSLRTCDRCFKEFSTLDDCINHIGIHRKEERQQGQLLKSQGVKVCDFCSGRHCGNKNVRLGKDVGCFRENPNFLCFIGLHTEKCEKRYLGEYCYDKIVVGGY